MDAELTKFLSDYPSGYAALHLMFTGHSMNGRQRAVVIDKLANFVRCIPQQLSPEKKARLLYEVVTRCVRYDHTQNHLRFTYVGALLRNAGVCMGIAELYAILCQACGIPCQVIIGAAGDLQEMEKSGHAWNLIRLNLDGSERWYHLDPTWDITSDPDPQFQDYLYYLKSDAYMESHQHLWLRERYPACPACAPPQPTLPRKVVQLLCHAFQKEAASSCETEPSS